MPNKVKTHEECRRIVCLLCMTKGKEMRLISDENHEQIKTYFIDGFNPNDHRLPNVLCNTCRHTVNDYSKAIFTRRIDPYDYSIISKYVEPPQTRSASEKGLQPCQCPICSIARTTLGITNSKQMGRPKSLENDQPRLLKLCS